MQWILGVASGKGGVGKSSVAAHLAVAFKDLGLNVGLLDADIYGPSQGMMFGIAEGQRPEIKDGRAFQPIEAQGVSLMSMAFLTDEKTPMVWRGPMASSAMQQLLLQTAWGALDILLVDLPPGTGDIQLTLAQKASLSGAVIVQTTPQDIAVLDAKKGIEMFSKVGVPLVGLIENMSYHQCSACGHQEALFGRGGAASLESRYKVPVLASLPLDARLGRAADEGTPLRGDHEIAQLFLSAAAAIVADLQSREQVSMPVIQDVDE